MTFVSGAAHDNGTLHPSNIVINAPASIVAGNLLVAFIATSNGTGITGPTGWTKESQESDQLSAVFLKVASGSEPSTYTFTWSGSGTIAAGAIHQYSGATATFDAASTYSQGTTSNNPGTIPSITPTQTGDTWVAFMGGVNSGSTVTNPSGFTLRTNSRTASWSDINGWDQPLASSAPTGTASVTFTPAEIWHGVSILVKAAPPPLVVATGAAVTVGPVTAAAAGTDIDTGLASSVIGPIAVTSAGTSCLRKAWLELNGRTLLLEDETQGYFCQSLDLGYPEVREVRNNRPDQDGVTDRTQYMGARVVTADITAVTGAGARIDEVASMFAPFMQPNARPVLHYTLDRPGVPERTLTLRGAGYSWPIVGAYQRDMLLQWVAADPIARDPQVRTATATPAASGTITSSGEVPVRPLLHLVGPITQPSILLAPPFFPAWYLAFISSFTIPAGHFVDIDTNARTVLYDGDPAKPRLASMDWTISSWQWVPPMPNATVMTLTGTATSAATQVVATWQDGYLT